jgi:DNA-binding Lrp family transcriptional regulator
MTKDDRSPDGVRFPLVPAEPVSVYGNDDKPTPSLDELDSRIIGFLTGDARMSARAIARRLDVSPGTVSHRISRLTRRSVISGYRTLINAEALGYDLHAILGLQTEQGPVLDDAVRDLLEIPEVEAVHIVTGQWDLLAELRLRDHSHLLDVLRNKIYRIAGFRHVETMISLMTHSPPGGWQPPELRALQTPDGDVRGAAADE